MEVITAILILLGVGLVLGQIFERFKLAAVAGEILGGFVMGPAVLGIIHPSSELTSIAEVALFFIVLLIGIEITTSAILRSYKTAVPISAVSFGLPVVIMVLSLYYIFGNSAAASVIVAISIGVPSISIVSVLVKNYGLLQKRSGQMILSSVIISDLLAFIVLSSYLNHDNVFVKNGAIIVFIAALFIADFFLARYSETVVRAFSRLHATEHGEKIIFGSIILGGLLAATFFQVIGFTYVLGAFFAGMIISEVVVGKELLGIITRTLNRINDSFFIPLYFTVAGLSVLVPGFYYILLLLFLLLITGGFGSFMTLKLGQRIQINQRPNNVVGFLGSRGAVGVVIAATALNAGLISYDLYSLVLLGTVILALVFPLFIRREPEEEGAEANPA